MINEKLAPEQLEEAIDRLSGTTSAKTLVQFLQSKVDELHTVSGVETIKELQGRKNAIRKLKEIINRLQQEKKPPKINEYS